MGLVANLKRNLNLSLADLDRAMDFAVDGRPSLTGVLVSPDTAKRVTAVFCAVRILSETLAQLPLHLYQRLERGKAMALQHPLNRTIQRRPNKWQTSYEWRRMMQEHVCLRGRGYSEIIYGTDGNIAALLPRHPDRIRQIQMDNGDDFYYKHTVPGQPPRVIAREDMFTIRGPFDGESMVGLFREAIGLGLAYEEHGAKLMTNGAMQPYAIKVKNNLKPEAWKNIKDSFKADNLGLRNAGKPMFLEEGMDAISLGMTAKDADFVTGRQFQVAEFARIWRIQPHKLMDLSRATFSNIEEQNIEFVQDTMLPHIICWEQRMDSDLLSEDDQLTYYTKFNLIGLLRGDAATRAAYYQSRFNTCSITPNGIRELEDENPIDDALADEPWAPMNMAPLSKFLDQASGADGKARAFARAMQDLLALNEGPDEGGTDGSRKTRVPAIEG